MAYYQLKLSTVVLCY
uniref:Uncharacterized protein n=1 Tax=Anguilla anguilla TaxID=7936 RepID=A0A0E9XYM9_ANGAN